MTVLKQEQWDYVRENYLVTADVLKRGFNWVTYGEKSAKSCADTSVPLRSNPTPRCKKAQIAEMLLFIPQIRVLNITWTSFSCVNHARLLDEGSAPWRREMERPETGGWALLFSC